MRAFSSFGALATHLVEREIAVRATLELGLEKILVKVEETAVSEIGQYQPAVGPFQDWAPLAESTEAQKAAKGYPEGAPLYAEGDLKESFGHEQQGLVGAMGSTDPKMVYHEFGTSKMPPRPVVGPAGYRNRAMIERVAGAAAFAGLVGGDEIHAALGYNFTDKD